jgi:hypothetical protein
LIQRSNKLINNSSSLPPTPSNAKNYSSSSYDHTSQASSSAANSNSNAEIDIRKLVMLNLFYSDNLGASSQSKLLENNAWNL